MLLYVVKFFAKSVSMDEQGKDCTVYMALSGTKMRSGVFFPPFEYVRASVDKT